MSVKTDSVTLYKMRRILSELSTMKGRGTELISLYIPPNKAIHEVISALREEYGTAANIKSDTTRTHVQDALVKTMQRLKLYKDTPETGLVIFCGALPTNGPGSEVVKIYEVIPPKPIQTYLYRCDDHFHLDILRDMLKEEKVIGILSIDTTEAGFGIVSGSSFEILEVVTSGVSGKTRAGGQSARRYERLRDMEITYYFNRVAKHAKKNFLEDYNVEGLIVSGPGPTKNDFLKGEYLDYRLQKNIIAIIDTSYAGSEGVRETVGKANKVLEGLRLIEEKELVQRFLYEVNASSGLATYGINDVLDNLRKGSVDTILISEDIGSSFIRVICKDCGIVKEKVVKKDEYIKEKQQMITEACSGCKGTDYEVEEKDFIEYVADEAANSATKVEVISSKTEEGNMLKSFGGIAAILRYKYPA
ncbi:MAG: peptide chain release factor aRF-1 [Nitrososphaerales archaeon]|nr:peptide chain release factor aRF-1 [Nitrososphaerales archaeon]